MDGDDEEDCPFAAHRKKQPCTISERFHALLSFAVSLQTRCRQKGRLTPTFSVLPRSLHPHISGVGWGGGCWGVGTSPSGNQRFPFVLLSHA